MRVRFLTYRVTAMLGAASLTMLFVTTPGLRAQDESETSRSVSKGLHTVKIVDVLNLFSNVGALIYFVSLQMDMSVFATHCSGTLIHERVFLLAGHCTAPTAGGLFPFIKAFVTFSPNALDRSTWLPVSSFAYHPSLPPCPPPEGCTFQGLDPGILDVGLVFLSRPVRHLAPARLAKPGTLETAGAAGKLMIVAGYGHLDSLPGGGAPPDSEWDGLRRIKISRLQTVVDNEWASWSLPGIVCFGDSGAPTFFRARIVAVASDGGDCYEHDYRARVDTTAAQDWIRQTIADVLSLQR